MSLDVVDGPAIAALRARAHPLRLRMLSLLTGASMSAAELARELDVSQALASYHLRQLAAAGLVDLAEERSRRGGQERRYRHRVQREGAGPAGPAADEQDMAVLVEAVVAELRRRSLHRSAQVRRLAVDAELWVRPEDWEAARQAVESAAVTLHEQARRPREPGTVHVNATVVMFGMLDAAASGSS